MCMYPINCWWSMCMWNASDQCIANFLDEAVHFVSIMLRQRAIPSTRIITDFEIGIICVTHSALPNGMRSKHQYFLTEISWYVSTELTFNVLYFYKYPFSIYHFSVICIMKIYLLATLSIESGYLGILSCKVYYFIVNVRGYKIDPEKIENLNSMQS